MTRVNVDRMRRYRQRTRTAPRRTLPFVVEPDAVTILYSGEHRQYGPPKHWYYGETPSWEPLTREQVEQRLREMGARTIEWTGKYEGIVSA